MVLHSVSGFARCVVDYRRPTFQELHEVFPGVYDGYERLRSDERVEACRLVPREGRMLREMKTIIFEGLPQTADVLTGLKELDCRPAVFEELVGYAKVCAQLSLHDRVVELGSVLAIDGHRDAAYFHWFPGALSLEGCHHESAWSRYAHILAVPL